MSTPLVTVLPLTPVATRYFALPVDPAVAAVRELRASEANYETADDVNVVGVDTARSSGNDRHRLELLTTGGPDDRFYMEIDGPLTVALTAFRAALEVYAENY